MFCNQAKYQLQHCLLQNNVSFPHFFPPNCQLYCSRRNCSASSSSCSRQLRVPGWKSTGNLSGKLRLGEFWVIQRHNFMQPLLPETTACTSVLVQTPVWVLCCLLTGEGCVVCLDITCGIRILACLTQMSDHLLASLMEENSLVLNSLSGFFSTLSSSWLWDLWFICFKQCLLSQSILLEQQKNNLHKGQSHKKTLDATSV